MKTLNATTYLSGSGAVIESLPTDQWKRELKEYFAIQLSATQTLISDYAIGPEVRDAAAGEVVERPGSEGGRKLCGMVRMRKGGGFA